MIRKIQENKEEFMPLLLIGDEEEAMVKKYLYEADLFALEDEAIAAVVYLGGGEYELKNIAVKESSRGKGLSKQLIQHILSFYPNLKTLYAGTGESNISFYEHLGFKYSHKIENFFTDNYTHPIIDGGILLKDMFYMVVDIDSFIP